MNMNAEVVCILLFQSICICLYADDFPSSEVEAVVRFWKLIGSMPQSLYWTYANVLSRVLTVLLMRRPLTKTNHSVCLIFTYISTPLHKPHSLCIDFFSLLHLPFIIIGTMRHAAVAAALTVAFQLQCFQTLSIFLSLLLFFSVFSSRAYIRLV